MDEEDDEEVVEDDEHSEKVKDMCKGCLKERSFDFIFEAKEFMTPDSHKKRLHYKKIFRDSITDTIEKDEGNKPEDVNDMIDDAEHLRNKNVTKHKQKKKYVCIRVY